MKVSCVCPSSLYLAGCQLFKFGLEIRDHTVQLSHQLSRQRPAHHSLNNNVLARADPSAGVADGYSMYFVNWPGPESPES